MSRDNSLIFSANQTAVGMNVGDTASSKEVDFAAAGGIVAKPLWWEVIVKDTILASGGASSVAPVLQESADNVTYNDLVVGPSIAKASLVTGYRFPPVKVPPKHKRYLRTAFRVITNNLTAGQWDSHLTDAVEVRVAG